MHFDRLLNGVRSGKTFPYICLYKPLMGKMQETVTAFFLIFSVKCPLHCSAGTELERTWNE